MSDSHGDGAQFDADLFGRVCRSVEPGQTIETIANRQPNQIVAITRSGLLVTTARSKEQGTGPQMVPAWMISRAWEHLCKNGTLSLQQLTEGLRVNRSSFIFALLSRFPDVEIQSLHPTRLRLNDRSRANMNARNQEFD